MTMEKGIFPEFDVLTAMATATWTTHEVNISTFMKPPRLPRGRWVAVCMVLQPDGTKQLRGARCTSKAKARAIAKQYGGIVRHYRAKHWKRPPEPKIEVKTWVKRFDGPTVAAPMEALDAG